MIRLYLTEFAFMILMGIGVSGTVPEIRYHVRIRASLRFKFCFKDGRLRCTSRLFHNSTLLIVDWAWAVFLVVEGEARHSLVALLWWGAAAFSGSEVEEKSLFRLLVNKQRSGQFYDFRWGAAYRVLSKQRCKIFRRSDDISKNFLPGMKGPESIQCTADSILSNPYAGIQFAFDKRRRNLEKRKSRLLQYEADLKEGKKLSEQQIEARFCIGEVETQLEFLKDISRILQSLQKEYLRGIKQRDDGMKKDLAEHERKRLEDFIYFQNVIERFGKVEVKDVFLNGTDNETKITEEECKVIENLSEPFGLKCGEVDILMDFKKKCTDGSKLAHKILVGSKEKVMNDFSGFQIRELLEKIANSGHMRHSAKEKDQFVKSDEPALESVVEQPKKDPKVVFVHVANGSMENYTKGDMNQAGDTEFGFEGGIDPKALVRDPPPPIPFPAMAVPEDPTNTVSGPNHNGVWRAG
ncbi:unnamed protein product [Onchocerca ochengi]|uniref:Caprin-1_dimer domain-containing protein n=1 Tax=Onchocerca ochengi TaxID=42157 RepID=A0A182EFV9_ONCOC|nr:unnamed protein product [Onchocerca ochengi]